MSTVYLLGTNNKVNKKTTEELKKDIMRLHGCDISELTYEDHKKLVTYNGKYISIISNPSEELCLIAINENSTSYFHIENPSDEVTKTAVTKNPSIIDHLKDRKEEFAIYVYSKDVLSASKFSIKGFSRETIMKMIEIDPYVFQYAEEPDEEMSIFAVSKNHNNIAYCKSINLKIALLALEKEITPSIVKIIESKNLTDQDYWTIYKKYPTFVAFMQKPSVNLIRAVLQIDPTIVQTHPGISLFILAEHYAKTANKVSLMDFKLGSSTLEV